MPRVPKKRNRFLDFSSLRSNVQPIAPLHLLLSVLIALLVFAYIITRNAEVLATAHTLVAALLITLGISLPGNPTH